MAASESEEASDSPFSRGNSLLLSAGIALCAAIAYFRARDLEPYPAILSMCLSMFGLSIFFLRSALRNWDPSDRDDLPYRFRTLDILFTWATVFAFTASGIMAAGVLISAWEHKSLKLSLLGVMCSMCPLSALFVWYKVRAIFKKIREEGI